MRRPLPWSYPFVMAASLLTGAFLGGRSRSRLNLSRRERWTLALGAFVGAMLGAKLVFLLVDPRASWLMDDFLDGGKTILGGMLGGYFGVELAKWTLGLRVKTGDDFVVPVAASVAVGRLGCFVAGCCYGVPTSLPWGVDFGDGVPRHPTQLYEAAFHGLMAFGLHRLREQGRYPRQLMKLYILSYLVYRFLTEFIRPEPRLFEGLTGYQLIALAMFPLFAYLWRRDRRVHA
jgi:phosphatidylglycerol:prolipoprotein diacylglycerol transferase